MPNLDELVDQLVQLIVSRLTVPRHLRIVALRCVGRHQQLRIVADPISGPAEMIVFLRVVVIAVAVRAGENYENDIEIAVSFCLVPMLCSSHNIVRNFNHSTTQCDDLYKILNKVKTKTKKIKNQLTSVEESL